MDQVISTLLPMLALGLLFTLAYAAEGTGNRALRWLLVLMLGYAAAGAVAVGVLLVAGRQALNDIPDGEAIGGALMVAGSGLDAALGNLGPIMVGLGVLGLLLLWRRVRALVARLVPIDPERMVHMVALESALLLLGVSAAIALFIPVLADDPEAIEMITEATREAGLLGVWMQNVGFALVALLGIGLFVRRDFRAALERLGLTRSFSLRWWAGATALGLASSFVIDAIWVRVAPEQLESVERLGETLFGPLLEYGLAGALTLGLAAGIGEELLFRGAAQPRLGLILTSLLFAALHTQYTVSLALVQVFIVAMLLGLVRQNANTTTAIGVHATYNFGLAMISLSAG